MDLWIGKTVKDGKRADLRIYIYEGPGLPIKKQAQSICTVDSAGSIERFEWMKSPVFRFANPDHVKMLTEL